MEFPLYSLKRHHLTLHLCVASSVYVLVRVCAEDLTNHRGDYIALESTSCVMLRGLLTVYLNEHATSATYSLFEVV